MWVVVYPDWAGADGDVGWVVVDAATGLRFGYASNDPRQLDCRLGSAESRAQLIGLSDRRRSGRLMGDARRRGLAV